MKNTETFNAMKRVLLEKRIEKLETELREEKIRVGDQRQRADKAEGSRDDKDRQLRTERNQFQDELQAERRARENAESIYDQHRNAVLHYFMAASNPETAKDTKRLVELQGIIVGLLPHRTFERQPKQPWES